MRIVELDVSDCRTSVDFMNALRAAIEAPDWHGYSVDAFIDSMVYGGINALGPPYTVRILGREGLPAAVASEGDLCVDEINGAARDRGTQVRLEVVS